MAFGAQFLAALRGSYLTPQWRVRSTSGLLDAPTGGDVAVASFRGGGFVGGLLSVEQAPSVLQPSGWVVSAAVWSVRVARNAINPAALRRGQCFEVECGLGGAFERVGLGLLSEWSITRGVVELTIRDLAVLGSRVTTDTGALAMFEGLASTTLTHAYTPGDTSLSVASSTGFEARRTAAAVYDGLLLITPHSGSPFYLKWTAKGAGTISVVDANQYGTTRVTASTSGSTVSAIAWTDLPPGETAARLLLSTGTLHAAHPTLDDLPEGWGFGLPADFVDWADILKRELSERPSSGALAWAWFEDGPVADPGSWLRNWLGAGGYVLLTRQGSLTARPLPGSTVPVDGVLTDRDFAAVPDDWQVFAAEEQQQRGAHQTTILGGTGSSADTLGTFPGLPSDTESTIDLSDRLWTNEGPNRMVIRNRFREWQGRPLVRVDMVLAGIRIDLSPLDVLEDQTRRVGLVDDLGRSTTGRRFIVSAVTPSWTDGTTRVSAYLHPYDRENP